MGFKNHIRHMETHCWRRSRKFIIILRVISGGMASISCRILSL